MSSGPVVTTITFVLTKVMHNVTIITKIIHIKCISCILQKLCSSVYEGCQHIKSSNFRLTGKRILHIPPSDLHQSAPSLVLQLACSNWTPDM